MCRSCADCHNHQSHLRQIGQIRKYLTRVACSNAVRSAVLSRLDYPNALLGSLKKMDLVRLQRVQNRAARLVIRTNLKITPPLCYVTCTDYRLVQGLNLSSACTCIRHRKKCSHLHLG